MANDNEITPPQIPHTESDQQTAPDEASRILERKRRIETSRGITAKATQLLNVLYQLIKTSQIHDLNNVAFRGPLEGFCKAINNLSGGEEEFQFHYIEDMVYVHETRLRTDISSFLSLKNLGQELGVRNIGGLTFQKGLEPDELKSFVQAFVNVDQKLDDPMLALRDDLENKGVKHVSLETIRQIGDETVVPVSKSDRTKFAMKTYFKAITSYKAIMKNIQNNKLGDARKAKKIVQRLVDLCLDEDSSFSGLATIKDFDEYTYNHSVNVCILSISFGQKLGLSKRQLCELGSAALFHDIGKTLIPIEVLNKRSKFTDDEWKLMQSHPVMGVKELLRMKGFSESTVYRVLVAHQHHIGMDGSGYPELRFPKELNFYTKIVSICDTFDAMTTTRVYQKAMRPDEALRLMSKSVAKKYDPTLLKAFVNTIGIFPVGTLVLLDSKEIAVVVEAQADGALMRWPKVKIAMTADGQILPQPRFIDLSESAAEGEPKYNIVKSLDPRDYRINIPHYVLPIS